MTTTAIRIPNGARQISKYDLGMLADILGPQSESAAALAAMDRFASAGRASHVYAHDSRIIVVAESKK